MTKNEVSSGTNRWRRASRLVLWGLPVLLLAGGGETGLAQVVLDGKFGSSGPVTGPNYNITPGMGRIEGNNLFQSFSQFNLSAGEVATFTGPVNIQNVLTRVTGSGASSINGTIRSDIAGANFFLINPNGVIFGPNAAINVSGAFAASSANYLKLADGARFVASLDADDSALSSAPVSAFGFLGPSAGGVSIQQSTLSVANGQTISLVGGDIAMDGGAVRSAQGRINVVSVQSAGEVPVDPASMTAAQFNAAFPQQGQISLQNLAQIDASGEGGGRIVIRGGQITLNNSAIQANTTGALNGQSVDVSALDSLSLRNGGQIKALSPAGLGAGGTINIDAQSVLLDGEGAVDDNSFPTTQISTSTGDLFLGGGSGRGGDIVIRTGTLELINSAQISAATFGLGDAGSVDITASSIKLDALLATATQIAANSQPFDGFGGNAGDIIIRTDSLDILNGAQLVATTFGSGQGGNIDIEAQSVNLSGFGLITPATYGTGNGGSVNLVTDSLVIDGSFIQAVTTGNDPNPNLARGGNISINAGSIDIRNGGLISATTLGSGNGGTINLTANSIQLTGDNGLSGFPTGIRAASGQDFGDGFILVGTGNGGDIVIRPADSGALDLVVSGGAEISTETLGSGNGGLIDISVSSLQLSSGGNISSASSSVEPGAGTAGNVVIQASGSVVLTDQGLITTAAPNAQGGNITITAGDQIQLTDSEVTAQAGPGGGGNITLSAPSTIYLLNSTLTAQAVGDGGNLSIVGPEFFIMNNSGLISRSSSANGGNITILSDYFFQSGSTIDASAPFGLPGTVSVSAPQVDLAGSLVGLPGSLLDAESLLRPDCAVRLVGDVSSFVVLGRGGLPIAPGGFVPSGNVTQ